MRVAPCVGLVIGCLVLTGCNHFGKKSPTAAAGGPRPPDPSSPFAPSNPPATPTAAAPPPNGTGILAGQVLGGFGSRPPVTFIQVKLAPEANQAAGAALEVEAKDGYFTIDGLQPGRHYQLIARAKDGQHSLAGVAWATPPNPRLLIRMSESFQTADTPPLPPPPLWPGKSAAAGTTAPASAATTAPTAAAPPPSWPTNPPADPSWRPVPRPTYNPYGVNPPQVPSTGNGLGTPVPKPDPTNIADQGQRADNRPPGTPIYMNGPSGPPAGWGSQPTVSTVVPSCVLTGTQLANFALNDLAGQPWEYRSHRSRLMLLDFWETACPPCQRAIPHLNILQQQYGTYGLSVVGIAYEKGTVAEQAKKVERVRGRLRINYTLLLGGDTKDRPCPLRTQFAIRAFPTLVLIDETGRILWRSEGLQKQQLAELELVLRQRLMAR